MIDPVTGERQRVLILGLGLSGFAAAELALRKNHSVCVLDESSNSVLEERAQSLAARGAEVELDWIPSRRPVAAALGVVSPGVSPDSGMGVWMRQLAIPVVSELEWGFLHCHCPVLAVTGTNGKTTTVEMTGHCLDQAGWNAPVAGNIGIPLSRAAHKSAAADCIVLEASSYQLERVRRFAPLAAALLNVSEDHLDRYPSPAEYLAAKLRLLECASRSRAVVLRDDLLAVPEIQAFVSNGLPLVAFGSHPNHVDFFLDLNGTICRRVEGGAAPILASDDLSVPGGHNLENAMAALALCEAAGLPAHEAARHLRSYVPSAHRLETAGIVDGVRCVNDSKSTNPDSLARALEALETSGKGRIVLIAGGLDKKLHFAPLRPLLQRTVRQAFLVGEARERLAEAWRGSVFCRCCQSLESAVAGALDVAEPGDCVLLSPGCASQDMFANYAERGTVFSELIRRRLSQ